MKERLLQARDAVAAAYAEAVCRLKLATRGEVKPATTDQAPSTKLLLSLNDRQLKAYRNREDPDDWKALPSAKTTEDAVGTLERFKGMSDEEMRKQRDAWTYTWMQHHPDRNSIGQPDLARSDVWKQRGEDAFLRCRGTGLRYEDLTTAEKKRVKNYFELAKQFGDILEQVQASDWLLAEVTGNGAKVEEILKEIVKV